MPPPRAFLVYLLIVLMELLPSFTLLLGLGLFDVVSSGEAIMWYLALSGVIGVAAALTLKGLPLPSWARRVAVMCFGLAAVTPGLLTSHSRASIFVSVLLLGVLYWRGLVAGSSDGDYLEVRARFGIGFAIFFLGLVTVIARGTIFDRSVWLPIAAVGIAYMVTCMIAMAVARTEHERAAGAGPAIALSVALQLLLLTFVAFLALQLFAINLVGDFFHSTSGLWNAIGTGIYHFALLIAKPIDNFISLIRPSHHRTLSNPTPRNPGINNGLPGKRPKGHPPVAGGLPLTIAGIIVGLFLVAAVAYAIWRTLPRLFDRLRPDQAEEEREWIWSFDGLVDSLLAWLRSLFRGSRHVSIGIARGVRRAFRPDYPSDPIRRIYAQLLFQAALAGVVRPNDATPREFCRLLTQRWPEAAPHFTLLTTAYEQRRYRESPPVPDSIRDMRGHLQSARKAIRNGSSREAA